MISSCRSRKEIDPNPTNDSNETPLYIAYDNNTHVMVKELLKHPRIIIDEMTYKLAVKRKDDAIIQLYSKSSVPIDSSRPKRKAAIAAREYIKNALNIK